MIASVDRGYGYPTSGAVPTQPSNPWVPATRTPGGAGPVRVLDRQRHSLLTSHGWKQVGGVLTCERRRGAAPVSPRAPGCP